MKQQLHLQVPTPCHENWANMNPVEKGRFCASCSKQVVDFTLMSDTEILSHLKKSSGNTCGRFSNDQLNRALVEPPKQRKTGWKWVMATVSSVLMFTKLLAQGNSGNTALKPKIPVTLSPTGKDMQDVIVGKIALPANASRTVSGKITDEKGKSIPHATVKAIGHVGAVADAQGNFTLILPDASQVYKLTASAPGYINKEISSYPGKPLNEIRLMLADDIVGDIIVVAHPVQKIHISGTVTDETTSQPVPYANIYTGNNVFAGVTDKDGKFDIKVSVSGDSLAISARALGFEDEIGTIALKGYSEMDVEVTMKPKIVELPAVTVISYPTTTCTTVTLGMVSTIRITDSVVNLTDSTAPGLSKTEPLTPVKTGSLNIYPNPVSKNSMITIAIPEKGEWKIQLVDNAGALLKTDNAMIGAKNTVTYFRIPENATAGMYYIRLVNRKGESVYTGKLIVQ